MSAVTPEIPVSWGELVDKITILEIKAERIADPQKLEHVRDELQRLSAVLASAGGLSPEGLAVQADLRGINERLWDVEDAIRACERTRDFGDAFIALARSVYQLNDRRFLCKRRINELAGSALFEEKSYDDDRDGG